MWACSVQRCYAHFNIQLIFSNSKALETIAMLIGAPRTTLAREGKTLSMEAILEELSTQRNLVEAQQRQIEQLQAACGAGARIRTHRFWLDALRRNPNFQNGITNPTRWR